MNCVICTSTTTKMIPRNTSFFLEAVQKVTRSYKEIGATATVDLLLKIHSRGG